MTTAQLQHIRMINQHGQAVDLDVRQDGRAPGLVPPGRRVRFKIRTSVLAYRVVRFVLPEAPDDWYVHDVCVGAQSQFSNLGDTPEEDGCPGGVFASQVPSMVISFATVQPAMDLVIDVRYRGPDPAGAPFVCQLQSVVADEEEGLPEGLSRRDGNKDP